MTDTELRRLAEIARDGNRYDLDRIFHAAASPDVVLGLLDRIKALEVERDEARVGEKYAIACKDAAESAQCDAIHERDARPAISREDAAFVESINVRLGHVRDDAAPMGAMKRILESLRAHAAKGGE